VPDLGRVVTIKGTVVDAKGTPQPQTFVAVSRTLGDVGAPSELVAYVLTSAKGTFTLHVPAGDDYRVTIYRF